jgi:hypothetical protein
MEVTKVMNIDKALHNPNGITKNPYEPYMVFILVFSTSSTMMQIW